MDRIFTDEDIEKRVQYLNEDTHLKFVYNKENMTIGIKLSNTETKIIVYGKSKRELFVSLFFASSLIGYILDPHFRKYKEIEK